MKPAWTVQFSQCRPAEIGVVVVVVVFSSGSG